MSTLSLAQLRELLHYDEKTGVFRWMASRGYVKAGTIAGYVDQNGYRCIDVASRAYKAHRLAWFYVHGVMPEGYIDHINGKKADNRISNLRIATNSQNQANRGVPKNNTSGFKGVHLEWTHKKWRATIWVRGEIRVLGRFDTKEEAAAAYDKAAAAEFGEFVYGGDLNETLPTAATVPNGIAYERQPLTVETLKEMFTYSPETGRFTRKVSRQGHAKAGAEAGFTEWTGQRAIKIGGKRYREHHLVWLYVHGVMPTYEIDHINGDSGDNRIANLREVTSSQNKMNRTVQKRSEVGLKGVTFEPRGIRKYVARIKIGPEYIRLGCFHTAQEASEAYLKAANDAFGEFSIGNR